MASKKKDPGQKKSGKKKSAKKKSGKKKAAPHASAASATPIGAVSCPECGSPMKRIVYGYPTSETFQRSARGEVALGGCVITGFDATHVCDQGHRWRRRHRRTGLDPSALAGVVVPGAPAAAPDPAGSEWISMVDPWDEFFAALDEDLANDEDPSDTI